MSKTSPEGMRGPDVPTVKPLAAADVPTIRPVQLAAATPTAVPFAAPDVLTSRLPPPASTPATASEYVTRTATLISQPSLVGRRIGNFVVELEIGRGGFGAVYLARHVDPGLALCQVIKVLHSELSNRREIVDRFRNEVRAATALSHQGIVHVEDFGQLDTGEQYIVMEHLVGSDLAAWFQQKGRLDLPEVLSLLEQAAEALDAAHKRGIVHRDLKPSNLFRLADGRLKVLDFGIAKLMGDLANPRHRTLTGLVMGTPHYMAPEQAILGMTRVTPLADIFALGVIAYELVTGVRPWSSTTIAEYVLEVNKSRPNPRALRSDLPIACANAIVTALDPIPANRPQTAGEFVRRLREGLSARRRSRRPVHLALTVGGALLVAAGFVIGIALGSRGNDDSPAPTAEPRAVVETRPSATPPVVAREHAPAATTSTLASSLTASPAPAPRPAPSSPPASTASNMPAASPPPPSPPPSDPAAATAAAPPATPGRLRISSTPDVADVFIGRKFQCSTEPPCMLTLPAGQHKLTVQNSRTSDEKPVWATVPPGREARLDLKW
jgi:serine/threonine-protein kinase